MVQRVCDTVFVGETDNVGEPFHKEVAGTEYHLNRSLPLPYAPYVFVYQFVFHDDTSEVFLNLDFRHVL